ncbi:hypothetical protein BU23DRAFT_658862 [Bimuria novae-zelandiae CBS 107.79]|uniref:Pentatricopeptide repeat protein-like protein n=1 Tax=Bimuria novae-zelandiae CBS 107.79 TaxID=1447943 RepID=A0A6A5USJ6_9PLEO|nr:hypothetical protein BU23DRAFT_658862 [Bimuria novae-zelandiae CBS 107.79]
MSLFRALDRTSAVSCSHAATPILTFLYPAAYAKSSKRSFGKSAINRPPRIRRADGVRMDNLFIQALARAGSCPLHAKQISTLREVVPFAATHHKTRRKSTSSRAERKVDEPAAATDKKGPFKIAKKFAQEELKALVDYYGIDTDPAPEEEPPEAGSLVWNVGDDHEPWPPKEPKDAELIEKLRYLLQQDEASHDEIFGTYQQLSDPRIVYLPSPLIRDMLHYLSIVERPTATALQRFLSILDDMKTAHIHISRSEWNSAIYLSGRYMGAVSGDALQSSLYLWRDMEQRANIKGSTVTFNVLFDIAVKAGKFTLAELFLKEMKARGLKLHRHFRVSLIYYNGVMQNGSGVRRVYQEMVDAGDIVDTAVMNAVIAALFRAGEPSAAEHVFERMKRLATTGSTSPFSAPGDFRINKFDRTWRGQRKLGLHLTHEGRRLKWNDDDEALKALQDWAPIAPNSRTYSLLIRHQATTTGNIDRVNELLREMGYTGIPLEGSIFVVIFHGFTNFGGVRYSSWTRSKLEQSWTEYLKAVRDGLDRTWIDTTSVVAALKAFKKCTDAKRTLEVWDQIQAIWKPSVDETEVVLRTLRNIVPQGGFFDKQM